MPKYFFDVKDGITVKDPTGLWCHDKADAQAKAVLIAEKVEQVEEGVPAPARHISIRDISGHEVDTVVIRDGVRPIKSGDIYKPGQ